MYRSLTSLKRICAAGFAASLLFVSACQTAGVADQDVAALPPAPTEDVSNVPPPPQPVAAQKNQVALLLPLTGANARVGRSLANAANMALLDLGGGDIELKAYDTAANGVERAAERAVADGAKLFLGPLMSENAKAIRGFAAAKNIPVLSFSNDATAAGGGVYVLGYQVSQSVQRVVSYARGRGIDRFAALAPNGDYGRRASDAFLASVRQAGGRVTAMESYERQRSKLPASVRRLTDFEARTARAAQGGTVRADGTVAPVESRLGPVSFQALLIADGGAIASEFLVSLDKFGAGPGRVRYLGTELWNADSRVAGARGLKDSWFASVPDARFNQMASRYRQRFGGAPSRLSSLAYDAVLLAQGVSNDWEVGGDFPRSRLADPDGFVGIDGIFRFGSDGVAQRGLEVQQVGNGTTRVIDAAPTSFQNRRVSMLVN
ncbi:MAG: penicillin-binding protein activator [Pacificimonas sp.]